MFLCKSFLLQCFLSFTLPCIWFNLYLLSLIILWKTKPFPATFSWMILLLHLFLLHFMINILAAHTLIDSIYSLLTFVAFTPCTGSFPTSCYFSLFLFHSLFCLFLWFLLDSFKVQNTPQQDINARHLNSCSPRAWRTHPPDFYRLIDYLSLLVQITLFPCDCYYFPFHTHPIGVSFLLFHIPLLSLASILLHPHCFLLQMPFVK